MPFAVHAAKWDAIDRLIEAAYAEFGRVDILVNNAGMSPPMPSHEVTEELFDSVVGLNFKGPFRLAAQVAKRMSDGDGGVIINVSSIGCAHAAAGRRALRQRQGGPERHDPVAGGRVRPEGAGQHPLARAVPHRHLQGVDRRSNGRRRTTRWAGPGNPEEIVTAALFLASPASSFTSGAIVRVDGGLQAGQ